MPKSPVKYIPGTAYVNKWGQEFVLLGRIKKDNKKYKYQVKFTASGNIKDIDTGRMIKYETIYDGDYKRDEHAITQIGAIIESKNHGLFKVLELLPDNMCKIEFLNTKHKKTVNRRSVAARCVRDDEKCNVEIGDCFDTISGQIKVISHKIKSNMSARYDVEFVETGNKLLNVRKLDLFSGILMDVNKKDRASIGYLNPNCNPYIYELFRYEFETIAELLVEYGEGEMIGIIQAYSHNDTIGLEFLDTIKFDEFKKFYRYLIEHIAMADILAATKQKRKGA